MLNEKKGTCCHRCGHVHVKGTSCPKPFLTGAKSCARRSLKEDDYSIPLNAQSGDTAVDGDINEAEQTNHYKERKAERGTIVGVEVAKAAYGEYNQEETNQKLIPFLQTKLNEKLAEVEGRDFEASNNYNLGVCVFMPILISGDKKYKVTMNTEGGDAGSFYLAIIMNNALITIYPTNAAGTKEVESAIDDHTKREYPDNNKESKALIPQSSVVEVHIDELYGKEVKKAGEQKVSEDALDYKVRTDYRLGATFDHKQFGPGKVVAAAGGGKAGTNGIVDWIEVKYAKPFMKGGKLQDTRRFNNILTNAYFGKTLKESSEEVKCKECGWHWKLENGGKDPYICHKCGHDNTPTRKEYHTMKHDGHDEHQQLRADIEERLGDKGENPCWRGYHPIGLKPNGDPNCVPLEEMSFQSPDILDFIEFVKQDSKALEYLGFTSIKALVEYLQDASYVEWSELRSELEQYKGGLNETDSYCPTCLKEYLLEYENKIEEAEYRGRKVKLGKPFLTPGGPKKRSVYVKNAKGKVVKVNFGDPNMRIKKSIPARRKSYRARHHCQSPGPRWKANYWSCRAW